MRLLGIGIILAIAASTSAGVIYIGGEISDLRSEIAKAKSYQRIETREQISKLQRSVDQLLWEKNK